MTASHEVEMVCHRGANRAAPENTLAAARAAFNMGAAFVELDVRASADGELVVIHDETFERTTNATGPINRLSMAEIARLDAGSWFGPAFAGERVPRLAEMLAVAEGQQGFYIEVKQADAAAVIELTEQCGLMPTSFFWSGDRDILDQLARLPGAVMIRHQDYEDLDGAIAKFRPAVIEFEPAAVSTREIARCRRHGIRPMAFYGGDDMRVFCRLAEAGVELFNIDRPEAFVAAFRTPG